MAGLIRDSYLEAEVLHADPVRLVRILYRAAVQAIGAARKHLRSGEIAERSRQITKAIAIVNELSLSIDHERGGEISRNLVELYDYVLLLLENANFHQTAEPLAEAQQLLETIQQGWEHCDSLSDAPVAAIAPLPGEYSPLDLAC